MTRHDMTEPNRSDFGAKLRTAREDRGVSLRQIAESTKISVATLEALESNDLEFLPGGIFTRSFVRNYASAVGLDPEESVREFLAQASAEPMVATRNYADDAEDQRQYLSQQRIARIALLIISLSVPIVALLLFLGWQRAPEELSEPLGSTLASPVAGVDENANSAVGGAVQRGTEAPMAAQETIVGPLTIAIHPRGPCWVSLTVDGERAFSRIMQPGEREVWEAAREVVIDIGDAGAFDYSVNRRPGRSLGQRGEAVTASIDRDNYRSFTTP